MRLLRAVPTVLAVAAALTVAAAGSAAAADPGPPVVTTGSASAIGQGTATVAGTVDPEGAATTYVVEYGTTASYGLTSTTRDAGAGADPVPVAVPLTGLTSDTTYHYRTVATNAAGTARGADRTLRTARVPRSPIVTTGAAREVTTGSAILTGTVDPGGLPTDVSFDYGTSTKYGSASAVVPVDGFGRRTVNVLVTGLSPFTKYSYRLVARNAKGTARGSARTVTTLRAPSAITITSWPRTVGWGGIATISGRVTGAGIGKIGLRVERNDFPFTGMSTKDVTATGDGTFSAEAGPLWVTSRLRVVTRTTVVAASPTITVYNRLRTGLRAVHRTARAVTFTGTLQPGVATATVSLQRRSAAGDRWVRVTRRHVTVRNVSTSIFRARIARTKRAAVYRAVVTPHDNGAHASGTTRTLRVAGRSR